MSSKNPRAPSPEQIERIKSLHTDGISGRQIAGQLALPVSTVARYIKNTFGPQRYKKQPKPTGRTSFNARDPVYVAKAAKAKEQRIVIPAEMRPFCNATTTGLYVPRELQYRGRV